MYNVACSYYVLHNYVYVCIFPELLSPTRIGMDFDGQYESIVCTPDNLSTVKNSLEAKFSDIECKKAGTCETTIQEPVCSNSKKKRSTGGSLTVTIGLHASVNSTGGNLNVAGLLQNNTGTIASSIECNICIKMQYHNIYIYSHMVYIQTFKVMVPL